MIPVIKDYNGNDVLSLFDDGINVDYKLPKWVNAEKTIKERGIKKSDDRPSKKWISREFRTATTPDGVTETLTNSTSPITIYVEGEDYEFKDNVSFDDVASANLKELTVIIKEGGINKILNGFGGTTGRPLNSSGEWNALRLNPISANDSVATRIKKRFNNWLLKKFEKKPEFDVVEFFSNVKLASKEGALVYRDRVSGYLQAIHNASMVGQTALLEQLLSEMIANKYEAMLNSHGCYYAIPETRIVDFIKKTRRGVNLCYLKNFTRPIPQEVIDKIKEVNEYEVFDNYVILHYDPKNVNHKETKKEEYNRKKDPILFGVISGSRKLYYITDWIDEVCDLTLEAFVDALGTTKNEFLVGGKDEPAKKDEPKKKKATAKPKKKETES